MICRLNRLKWHHMAYIYTHVLSVKDGWWRSWVKNVALISYGYIKS